MKIQAFLQLIRHVPMVALPILLFAATETIPIYGETPTTLSLQAKVAINGTTKFSGKIDMNIGIYYPDSDTGPLWENTHTVNVVNGNISVILGQDKPISSELFYQHDLRIGFQPLIPNQAHAIEFYPMMPVPYAFHASIAERADRIASENILFLDTVNTRVGINNTSPQYTLDVSGTVNATTFYGDGSQLTNIQIPDDKRLWNRISQTNNIYYSSGNVGIGIDSPEAQLHVNGHMIISGNVTVLQTLQTQYLVGDGSGLTNIIADNITSGNLHQRLVVGEYPNISGLGTISTGTWNASEISDSYVADNLTLSGATITGTNYVSGNLTITGPSKISGDYPFGIYTKDWQVSTNGTAQFSSLNIGGTTYLPNEINFYATDGFLISPKDHENGLYISELGNVGIHTTSPQSALDIQGAIRIGTSNVSLPGVIQYKNNVFQGYISDENTGNGSWVTFNASSDVVPHALHSEDLSHSNMVYVRNDGHVGIGGIPSSNIVDDVTISGNVLMMGHSIDPDQSDLSISGAGARLIWYPKKVAFRSGYVQGDEWDDGNIGFNSVVFGYSNKASGDHSVVLGGRNHVLAANDSVIVGGYSNIISSSAGGFNTIIGGGSSDSAGNRIIGGGYNTIIGGQNNSVSGSYSTVISGHDTSIHGDYGIAFGQNITIDHNRAFIFSDGQSPRSSTDDDQFLIFARGGVGIHTEPSPDIAMSVSGTVNATHFVGDGSGLYNLDVQTIGGYQTSTSASKNSIYISNGAGFLPSSVVNSSTILDGSILGDDITKNTIESQHIKNYSIQYNDIANDAIGSRNIMDGAITSSKIQKNAITSVNIADSGIVSVNIAPLSIFNNHIVNDAIGSRNIMDGAITSSNIMNHTITGDDIADGQIVSQNIATDAIQSHHIASATIVSDNLSVGAIQSHHLTNQSISSINIATHTITSRNIANQAITSRNIADGAIQSHHIADDVISSNRIINYSITSKNIADNAITSRDIADHAITSRNIANGAIQSNHIGDGMITSHHILDGTITSQDIAIGAISSDNISINSITTDHILNFTITSADIKDGSIDFSVITDGGITSKNIGDAQIVSRHIAIDAIGDEHIATGTISWNKLIQDETLPTKFIQTNSIPGSALLNDSIGTDQIQDGSITADKLAPNSISTNALIGVLPIEKGGTGTDSFDAYEGAVMFASNSNGSTQLMGDLNHLVWDDSQQFLGVGIASPQQSLHVSGNIWAEGGRVLFGANGTAITFFDTDWNSSEGYITIGPNTDTHAPEGGLQLTDIYVANRVGIGVLNAINPLDVSGSVAIGSGYAGTFTAPENGMIIEGDVGIGTTNVTHQLTIDGGLSGTEFFSSGGIVGVSASGGSIGIDVDSTDIGIQANGDTIGLLATATSTGAVITVSNIADGAVGVYAALTNLNGETIVDASLAKYGNDYAAGVYASTPMTSLESEIGVPSQTNWAAYFDGPVKITGDLGIGLETNQTPSADLHVNGTIQISQTLTFDQQTASSAIIDWSNGMHFTYDCGTNDSTITFTAPSVAINNVQTITLKVSNCNTFSITNTNIKWQNNDPVDSIQFDPLKTYIISIYYDGEHYYALSPMEFE